ncbi:MAG: ribonuclease III [Dehalococcoidia bacterium]|nr:MAG: ribonuclease III [Dehalococcoidia bacterium]
MTNLITLQNLLNINFRDESLLKQALIHSSYTNENPKTAPVHNERLEFLGDAILGMIIAERLFKLLPNTSEGELTRLRAALVCRSTLYQIAKNKELNRYLYLGRGEEASGGRNKPTNLSRALEAIIGAVFLDNGFSSTTEMVLCLFDEYLKEIDKKGVDIDYKSRLQQITQSKQQKTPIYRITHVSGSSHEPVFTAEVSIDSKILGIGCGRSKKTAEAAAARSALEQVE